MTRPRRLALLDLGWEDADAIVRGLSRPDVEVGLVLGNAADAPGLRVARMLGVPHSTDLVDLTRELFDVAVIGAASQRRAALERLVESLGAVVESSPVAAPARPDAPNGSDRQHAGGDHAESWMESFGEASVPTRALNPAADEPMDARPAGARRVNPVELSWRVAWALERNRVEGTRATLHRVTWAEGAEHEHASALAACFRATDAVCRTEAHRWVLLCSGSPVPSLSLERRLRDALGAAAAPVRHERVALACEADAAAFENAAREWLRSSESGVAHDR